MKREVPLHDDVIKWKHFPRYWTLVRGTHRSLVNSPHKGQWRVALTVSLICAWTNSWANNRDAGDLRSHHSNYDATVVVFYAAQQRLVQENMTRNQHGLSHCNRRIIPFLSFANTFCGLMHERCNSSRLTKELRFYCINPSLSKKKLPHNTMRLLHWIIVLSMKVSFRVIASINISNNIYSFALILNNSFM